MRDTRYSRRTMLATMGTAAAAAACSPGNGQTVERDLPPDLTVDLLDLVPAGEVEAVRAGQSDWNGDDIFDEAVEHLTKKRSFARLRMGGGRLKLSRPHALDAHHVDLDLQGQLDFSGLREGTALRVYRSGNGGNPFDRHPVLRGLSMIGPGAGTRTQGLMFDSPDHHAQNISVTDFVIRNFGLATGHGQNGYLIDYSRGHITMCDLGFEAPGNVANGGERMSFSDVTFAANRVSIRSDNVNASVFVNRCSIDYPTGRDCRFVDANRGGISLTDCHIEGNSPADRMGAVSAFRQGDGADAQLTLRGGRIVFADPFDNHVWENLNTSAPIVVDDVYMIRGKGRGGILASGRITARLKYIDGGGDHTNGHLLSRAENRLFDSEVRGLAPQELLIPAGQRPDAVAFGIARGVGRERGNVLQLRFNESVHGKAVFAVPCMAGQLGGVDAGYQLAGPNNACSARLLHVAARVRDDGTINILREDSPILETPLAAASRWSALIGGTRNVRAPAWATHTILILESSAGLAATMRLDALTITLID